MDAAVCALACPAAGTPICPQARGATAAANIIDERKSRCLCMATYLPGVAVEKARSASRKAPDQKVVASELLARRTLDAR